MHRELARKRPAVVVSYGGPVRPPSPVRLGPEEGLILRYASRAELAAAVTGLYREGRIRRDYRVGRQGDVWLAEVRLKRPAPRWLRPALWAAGGVSLAGLAVWVVKVVVAAVATLAVALVPWLVGGVVILFLFTLAGRGRVVEVVQKVRIR